jgi:predicted transposase YdaD
MIQNDVVEGYRIEIDMEKQKAEEAKRKAEEAKRKAEEAEQRANSYVARMKAQGLSIEAIMDITGLSRDEIETL